VAAADLIREARIRHRSMKISIITAVHNSRETIESCLQSVLGQDWKDLEYIVVDGASTDGTLDIINKYRPRINTVVSHKDDGVYHALNEGLELASGEVVGILHADDIYAADDVLSRVADVFAEKDPDSVYGDLVYTKRNGELLRYWKAGDYDSAILKSGWMPPHPSFFVKRSVYKRYGPFNTDFKIAADYELMLRFLFKRGISAAYLPEVLVKMRVGGKSNKDLGSILAKSREDYRILKMHGAGGLRALLFKNILKIPQFFARPPQ